MSLDEFSGGSGSTWWPHLRHHDTGGGRGAKRQRQARFGFHRAL
jgi:hypothetical protein